MTRLTADWLRCKVSQRLLSELATAGFQAFFVGGCVRNAILKLPAGDIDIATNARPRAVTDIAKAAGMKVIPTGIDHGTVTVVENETSLEVTTFRKDVETDGRRAVVAFSDRVEDDARRRDFTMNALYADAMGQIIDPLGGLPDLTNRIVRFIDDPHARIREDYLRILRYFRFHAWYGDAQQGLDPEALAACAELAYGIDRLSAERVGSECIKLLSAPDPAPSLAAMAQSGILMRIVPGADAGSLAPLVHLEAEASVAPDPIRRLAAIGGDAVAERLRLSRANIRKLTVLKDQLFRDTKTAEIAWRHGADIARDVVLLRSAQAASPLPSDYLGEINRGARATFPVKSGDLMPRYTGKRLGDALRRLEARWIASDFCLSKQDLLDD